MHMILRATGLAAGLVLLAALVVRGQDVSDAKAVFLRDSKLVTAQFKGSVVKELVTDSEKKSSPTWSPRGDRIIYRTPGQQSVAPRSHANLVVIDADGRPVARAPVLSMEADGTVVGGLRFVETSGWHSDDLLFVSGSIGPQSAEYRLIDLSGRVKTSYFGTGFATCADKGLVAYVAGASRSSRGPAVEVNGETVFTSERADTSIDRLLWTQDCERLAVMETPAGVSRLVIVRNKVIEARLPLPLPAAKANALSVRDTFLLLGINEGIRYDTATRSLVPAATLPPERPKRAWRISHASSRLSVVNRRIGGSGPQSRRCPLAEVKACRSGFVAGSLDSSAVRWQCWCSVLRQKSRRNQSSTRTALSRC